MPSQLVQAHVAGLLHNLETAKHVTLRVRGGLALLLHASVGGGAPARRGIQRSAWKHGERQLARRHVHVRRRDGLGAKQAQTCVMDSASAGVCSRMSACHFSITRERFETEVSRHAGIAAWQEAVAASSSACRGLRSVWAVAAAAAAVAPFVRISFFLVCVVPCLPFARIPMHVATDTGVLGICKPACRGSHVIASLELLD